MDEITKTVFMYLVIILGIAICIKLITREYYKNVVDYRMDSTLRENFKSCEVLHQPKGLTNTTESKKYYEKILYPTWDNFRIIDYVFHSSPVPEYLPQDIIKNQIENVDKYDDNKNQNNFPISGKIVKFEKAKYPTSEYML